MECKHEFIGTVFGVSCKKCGVSLTAEEYGAYITAQKQKKPRAKREEKQ